MLVLAVDTSGSNCSCALSKNGILISENNLNFEKQHSILLMPMIEEMFKKVNLQPKELTHMAINVGPGSFTGLRIGISVVKAMAKALDIPVYSYDTFRVFAESVSYYKGNILVVSDALKDTFYSKFYSSDGKLLTPITDSEVRSISELQEIVVNKKIENLLIIGDGLIKKSDLFKSAFPNAVLTNNNNNIAKASTLCRLAEIDIENNIKPETQVLPLYMRKPQAVREYEIKHGKFDDNL